jgi:hypothetical protein
MWKEGERREDVRYGCYAMCMDVMSARVDDRVRSAEGAGGAEDHHANAIAGLAFPRLMVVLETSTSRIICRTLMFVVVG